jgi:N-acetylmuramoyl-L-alanine amidase
MKTVLTAVSKLVIHHSESPMAATTVEDIKRWHLAKGWSDIGYHAVIDMRGTVHWGRSESIKGAHAQGANWHSLGLCVIGNFDNESPRKAQWSSLLTVIETWCRRYHLTPSVESVIGHRDVPGTTKSCPGKNLYGHLPWVRQEVRKQLLLRAAEASARA